MTFDSIKRYNALGMGQIRLRAIEPEDLELVYSIENDRELWNVGTTNVPYSRFALSEFIINTKNDIYADRQLRLMIDNDKGETIGIADIMDYDPRHNRAEIGLVIIDKWRRQGYATEVIRQIKDYARRTIHLHKLYAIISNENEAAIKLFQKAGFTNEAVLKDWLYDGADYHDAIIMSD